MSVHRYLPKLITEITDEEIAGCVTPDLAALRKSHDGLWAILHWNAGAAPAVFANVQSFSQAQMIEKIRTSEYDKWKSTEEDPA